MKIKKHIILITLLLTGIIYFLPENVQVIFALLLIVSIGLLHGSNDIKIIERLSLFTNLKKNYLSFLYGFIVLIVLGLFFVIPFIVLPFFIMVSAYHFGEQHFGNLVKDSSKKNNFIYMLYFSYGLYIFFLLFYIEYEATASVVSDIDTRWFSRTSIGYILAGSFICTILGLFIIFKEKALFFRLIGNEFMYLAVYLIMFNLSSLIVGFALYFSLWHSLPSLKEQQKFLYKNKGFEGFRHYFLDSWKYWLLSLIGLSVFFVFFYDLKNIFSILFAFVAAITFPHVIIMQRMFLKQSS